MRLVLILEIQATVNNSLTKLGVDYFRPVFFLFPDSRFNRAAALSNSLRFCAWKENRKVTGFSYIGFSRRHFITMDSILYSVVYLIQALLSSKFLLIQTIDDGPC